MNKHHLVILRLLRDKGGEMYGLDLVRADESRTLGMGSVYSHLYNLELAGEVSSRLEEESELLPRRLYRITPGGRRRLIYLESSAPGGLEGEPA